MGIKLKKLTKEAVNTLDRQQICDGLKVRAFLTIASFFVLMSCIQVGHAQDENTFPVAGDREPIQKITVVATAYSSDVWQTDDTPCIPADGYNLCKHYEKYGEGNTIAANFLSLGTQVKIPELFGDKVLIVHDRMNKRYGYGRIDICMPTREEAKEFGVKYIEIETYGGNRWKVVSR